MQGYYDDAILFMRNLFSGGFKDNPHLSFGFLTGILRVAKESIFSGLNNIKINSILDDRYSEYFGFTAEEVRQMAAYYQASEKYGELCEWYDGYHFGNTDIFNPWSVVSYFNNGCCPQAFWMSTGSNDIIGELLEDADADTLEQLHALMSGGQILTRVDTSVIYPQLHQNGASIYSFLLVAGYLKAEKTEQQFGGDYMCEVSLPNKEITFVYSKEILGHMQKIVPQSSASAIQAALYMNKTEALENALNKFLIQTISYNDASSESFYHGLILGICAMFDNRYLVSSNRESGEGRFDIQLMPKDKKMPGILMELKAGKELEEKQLGRLAEQALDQIEERVYETEMRRQGISEILKYGVAFSGKQVQIRRKADNHAG